MKQRLVGTLVLGSLALILIPLLLDGEGIERPPLSANIPPAPVFDTSPLPEPQRPEITADALNPDASAIDPPVALTDEAAEPAAADSAATTDTEEQLADASSEGASAETITDTTDNADNADNTEDALEAAVAALTNTPEPAPQSISEPALDASGLPEAWTVRLGSFGNRANADSLVSRLIAAGHKAYIRPVVTGQGALHGVYVGPVPTRNEATALQTELKSRFQINDAIVQRFDIAQ